MKERREGFRYPWSNQVFLHSSKSIVNKACTATWVNGGWLLSGTHAPGTRYSFMQEFVHLLSQRTSVGGLVLLSIDPVHSSGVSPGAESISHAGSPTRDASNHAIRLAAYSAATTSPVGVTLMSHGQLGSLARAVKGALCGANGTAVMGKCRTSAVAGSSRPISLPRK